MGTKISEYFEWHLSTNTNEKKSSVEQNQNVNEAVLELLEKYELLKVENSTLENTLHNFFDSHLQSFNSLKDEESQKLYLIGLFSRIYKGIISIPVAGDMSLEKLINQIVTLSQDLSEKYNNGLNEKINRIYSNITGLEYVELDDYYVELLLDNILSFAFKLKNSVETKALHN